MTMAPARFTRDVAEDARTPDRRELVEQSGDDHHHDQDD
jgi:hypothetical protein